MYLSFLHIFSWLESLCLFSTERYFIVCMYHSLFTHLLTERRYPGCIQIWALTSKMLVIFKIIESQNKGHEAVGIHWLFCTVGPEIRSMVVHFKLNPDRWQWRSEEGFGQNEVFSCLIRIYRSPHMGPGLYSKYRRHELHFSSQHPVFTV